jgi:translation initiation factor 3 subunit D
MASFSLPYVTPNAISWGPPSEEDLANPNAPSSKFSLLPYAPFGRGDRLGRVADFTGRSNQYNNHRQGRPARDDNEEFQYKVDAQEESTFQLVDTAKAQQSNARRFVTPAAKRRQHTQRLRQINARRQQGVGTALQQQNMGGRGGRGGVGGRGGRGSYGRGGRTFGARIDRQASVSVQSDWKQVEELDLAKLTKLLSTTEDVPKEEDIVWCGFLDQYNDAYDKVTARAPVPLKRNETKEFYPVTTTDDPVLEKLAIDGNGNVFITDTILAHLMTCTRSVYPWDLVIQKLPGGTLFFDKRDNSQFDYLTVHETAHAPPTNEAADSINHPERLGLEATMIHQNFTQQILRKAGRTNLDMPNPFFDEDDNDGMEPASVAYRYRKFDLGGNTNLVCRTELHGLIKGKQYMTAFALNEYVPPSGAVVSWSAKLDSQRGAVLATELKNNSFKLAKWTAQSLLAGADQMKIGFVSRVQPKNAYEHQIMATQFYRPKDFATQITLHETQMWAMVRMFIALVRKQEDGKYVLMRDPNKNVLRLFQVPPGTFEEEEEDEEDAEAAPGADGAEE